MEVISVNCMQIDKASISNGTGVRVVLCEAKEKYKDIFKMANYNFTHQGKYIGFQKLGISKQDFLNGSCWKYLSAEDKRYLFMGYYSVAGSFIAILGFIPSVLSQTITPILVQLFGTDKEQYKQKAQLFMNVTIWLCVLMCIAVCLCAYPLIRYTYGIQYLPAVSILQVAVFREIFLAQSQVTGSMILSEHIQKPVAWRNIIGCFVCIGLNVLLIPRYGAMGAAVVSILTALFTGFISHLIIPTYRHIFRMQCRCFFIGWKDIVHLKSILKP